MNSQSPKKGRGNDIQRFCIAGLFVFALIGFIYVSKPVLLPVILALILMLIFRPFHLIFIRYLRFPQVLSSLVIVLATAGGLIMVGYFLAAPASNYLSQLQEEKAQTRLREVFAPIKSARDGIAEVAHKVEKITEQPSDVEATADDGRERGSDGQSDELYTGDTKVAIKPNRVAKELTTTVISPLDGASNGGTVKVQIKEDTVKTVYSVISDFGFYILSTLVLLFFLLAYGAEMSQRMGEARGTPELLTEIEHDVSGYLFTITTINLTLGAAIGSGLWLIGLPNPILWGLMAALLNFIPYAGALIGAAVVTIIAAMDLDNPAMTIAAGVLYLGLSTIEGNFITPALVGRRLEINPIIVFVWVLAWAAVWGIAGMLIGLPLLIIFRIVCSRIPSLAPVERAITVRSNSV